VIPLFRQKSPGNVAVLLVFGLLIKLPLFLYPKSVAATTSDTPFYKWLQPELVQVSEYLPSVIAFFLLYLQSLMLTSMINEYRMTNKQTFLPGMAYMLVTSLLPEWSYFSAPLIASTFLIWAYIKLFELYHITTPASGRIFNIGLLLGLASIFFFPSIGLLIGAILGIVILRPFKLNEFFLLLLGITTPYYFYSAYLLLTDSFQFEKLLPVIDFRVPPLIQSIWVAIAIAFVIFLFLGGSYFVQINLRKMLIQARKNWSIILFYLLIAFCAAFFNSNILFVNWFITLAPFAAFHSCAYLYPPNKTVPIIFFYVLLGFILAQQYLTPYWH
jgi:hypothetical protein